MRAARDKIIRPDMVGVQGTQPSFVYPGKVLICSCIDNVPIYAHI
jgi:hypothetical protein